MASSSGFLIVFVILTGLCVRADGTQCRFPSFMYEAPGWDSGIRNEGRSSRYFIIFEDAIMITIDYDSWDSPDTETECVRSVGEDKVIVSFSSEDGLKYKCIHFIKRSTHVIQLMESEPSSEQDDGQCEELSLAINDWLLVWLAVPTKYQDCGFTGGFDIKDIYSPTFNQHHCRDLSLPPRMESECEYGEGILINFRYPQCAAALNMPINEVWFTCLGSWSFSGYSYKLISDGATFLPGLWLMRFPGAITEDFYMEFMKDIVADRAINITQTEDYFQWRLVKGIFPSLCEDESSECSDCTEDDGYYCQKSCQKCNSVTAQQRCSFKEEVRGEWLEYSWSGSRTIRITSSLLYPAGLSPFECFAIGEQDSLDWLEVTGRQTLVSVYKNGCRPRYSCVAISHINPSVIQYRLSQSLVWPHSQTLNAEDICDFYQFTDDDPPLGNVYRSQYEKYLVKGSTGADREFTGCNFNTNLRFTAIFNSKNSDTCVGTLKQCSGDETRLTLHLPSCQGWKSTQTFDCLSSTVEIRERFLLVQDSDDPSKIYCIIDSTESYDQNGIYFLYGSDCHVNIMISIPAGIFNHHIAHFTSVEQYNTTTECSVSDVTVIPSEESETTSQTPSISQEDDIATTETLDDIESAVTGNNDDKGVMPLFSDGYYITSTEKQFETPTTSIFISADFTTDSTDDPSKEVNIQRDITTPRVQQVRSGSSTILINSSIYFILLTVQRLIYTYINV